jgi:hypothetical protein
MATKDMDGITKGSWGNSIRWLNFDSRRITGHISPYSIKVGDLVRDKFESGNIYEFKVISIEWMNNPSDQFFATVKEVKKSLALFERFKKNFKKLIKQIWQLICL